MKTERRHELHENLLAKQLTTGYEKARPYTFGATAIVVVALAAYVGYTIYTSQSQEKSAEAWDDYYAAREPGPPGQQDVQEKLQEVIKKYPGTVVEDWARLAAADAEFSHGIALQVRDQSAGANKHLNTAVAEYVGLKQKSSSDDIRQRATFRLALAYEALGQVDKARKEYSEVKGAFQKIAEGRAEELNQDEVREFYDWYVKAEAPSDVLPTDPGTPGHRPPFSVDQPGDSPLKLPGGIGDFTAPADPNDVQLPSSIDDLPSGEAPDKSDLPDEGSPPEPSAESADEPSSETPSESPPDDPAPEAPVPDNASPDESDSDSSDSSEG